MKNPARGQKVEKHHPERKKRVYASRAVSAGVTKDQAMLLPVCLSRGFDPPPSSLHARPAAQAVHYTLYICSTEDPSIHINTVVFGRRRIAVNHSKSLIVCLFFPNQPRKRLSPSPPPPLPSPSSSRGEELRQLRETKHAIGKSSSTTSVSGSCSGGVMTAGKEGGRSPTAAAVGEAAAVLGAGADCGGGAGSSQVGRWCVWFVF